MKKSILILIILSMIISILPASAEVIGIKNFPSFYITDSNFNADIVIPENANNEEQNAAENLISSIKENYNIANIDLIKDNLLGITQNLIIIGIPKEYSEETCKNCNQLLQNFNRQDMKDEDCFITLDDSGEKTHLLISAVKTSNLKNCIAVLKNANDYDLACKKALVLSSTNENSPIARCFENYETRCSSYDEECTEKEDCCSGLFCKNKRCVTTVVESCSDTDYGKNYFEKGTVYENIDNEYIDYCQDSRTVREYYCEKNKKKIVDFTCADNEECYEGMCKKITQKSECTSDNDCNDDNLCTQDSCVGTPKKCQNTETDCVKTEKCSMGKRTSIEYCDIDSEMKQFKQYDEQCINSFECSSNMCSSNKCYEPGLFKKFMSWLKTIFG